MLIALCAACVAAITGIRERQSGMTRVWLIVAGILLLLSTVSFVGAIKWTMEAHGVPKSKLSQLTIGMTSGEVIVLLGRPSNVHYHDGGAQTWTYRRNTWCVVNLLISSDGTLTRFDHDH
jgi:hypothetical protein